MTAKPVLTDEQIAELHDMAGECRLSKCFQAAARLGMMRAAEICEKLAQDAERMKSSKSGRLANMCFSQHMAAHTNAIHAIREAAADPTPTPAA